MESFAKAWVGYEMGGIEFERVFGDVYFEGCLGAVVILWKAVVLVVGVGVGVLGGVSVGVGILGGVDVDAVVCSSRHGESVFYCVLLY